MVVGHLETIVVEEARQCILLAHAVAEHRAQQATLVLHPLICRFGELEERDDEHTDRVARNTSRFALS